MPTLHIQAYMVENFEQIYTLSAILMLELHYMCNIYDQYFW